MIRPDENQAQVAGELICLGVNHRTAPVELRERLAFSDSEIPEALSRLISEAPLKEGLILSTCNRVEIYGVGSSGKDSFEGVKKFIADCRHVDIQALAPHCYGYRSLETVKHAFRVASSLDSMVIGEPQITGQVKKAYLEAVASHTAGTLLNRFMHRVLFVAKRIRTETGISKKAVSVGSAAVDLAEKIFGDLSSKKVVLLGAGEIGELVLTSLKEAGVSQVDILNRTLETASLLESKGLGRAHSLEEAGSFMAKADVVITSLGGKEAFITAEEIRRVMHLRKNQVLFLIDLGVPRNIDPAVNEVSNVYLYNIDDLQKVVETNRSGRESEARKAEEIIEKEASLFFETVLQEQPTIGLLGRKFERIRRRELQKTMKRLSHLSEGDKQALEKCTEAIVSRILHDPILALKEDEVHQDWKAHHLLARLFRLEEDE